MLLLFYDCYEFLLSLPIDLSAPRLEKAKEIGADFTIQVKGQSPEVLASMVESLLGCMPDITLECTGAESCIQTGIYVSVS